MPINGVRIAECHQRLPKSLTHLRFKGNLFESTSSNALVIQMFMLCVFLLVAFYIHYASCTGVHLHPVEPLQYRSIFLADLQSRIFSDKTAFRFESESVRRKVYENQRIPTLSQSSLSVVGVEFGVESYEQAQREETNYEVAKTPFSLYKSGNEYRYTSSYPSYTCFNIRQGLETVRLSSENAGSSDYVHPSLIANIRLRMIVSFLKRHQQDSILSLCSESVLSMIKFPRACNYHPRKFNEVPFWCLKFMIECLYRSNRSRSCIKALNALFPLYKTYVLSLRTFDTVKLVRHQLNWIPAKEPLLIAYTKRDLLAPFVFSLENDSMLFFIEPSRMVVVIEFHPNQPDAKFAPRESLRLPFGVLFQELGNGYSKRKFDY